MHTVKNLYLLDLNVILNIFTGIHIALAVHNTMPTHIVYCTHGLTTGLIDVFIAMPSKGTIQKFSWRGSHCRHSCLTRDNAIQIEDGTL